MIDTTALPDRSVSPSTDRRWGRFRWAIVAVAVLLVAGGATTAGVLVEHYRGAPPLECVCVYAPVGPHGPIRESQAGDLTQDLVVADSTARRGFEVAVINRSGVTQTVLGLASDGTVVRPRLAVGLASLDNDMLPLSRLRAAPVSVPPGHIVDLAYTVTPRCMYPGTSISWNSIDVRVRVGGFTRTETVGMAGQVFAIQGTKATSARC